MPPDSWCARLEHHCCDVCDLPYAAFVTVMDLELAERDHRGRFKHSDDPVGITPAEATLEARRRLAEPSELEHLPALPRLRHPQRPVLTVALRGGDALVCDLKGFLESVERDELRGAEGVGQAVPGIFFVGGRQRSSAVEDIEGLLEVRELVLQGGFGDL